MQVIKICHFTDNHRYITTSLFFSVLQKTPEEIKIDINSIKNKKIKAQEKLEKLNSPTGYFSRIIDNFPDHYTIAQAKQKLKEQLKEWEAKCKEEAILNESFDQCMIELGYLTPENPHTEIVAIDINWPKNFPVP